MRGWYLSLLLLCSAVAFAKDTPRQVVVADPFLEMHSGPGKGYPVFFVVPRADQIEVIKERTAGTWCVNDGARRLGERNACWPLELDGEAIKLEPTLPTSPPPFRRRADAGDLAAPASYISGGYGLTDHLSVGLTLANALGNISNAEFAIDVTHHPRCASVHTCAGWA
jgi:hypothetical protein